MDFCRLGDSHGWCAGRASVAARPTATFCNPTTVFLAVKDPELRNAQIVYRYEFSCKYTNQPFPCENLEPIARLPEISGTGFSFRVPARFSVGRHSELGPCTDSWGAYSERRRLPRRRSTPCRSPMATEMPLRRRAQCRRGGRRASTQRRALLEISPRVSPKMID